MSRDPQGLRWEALGQVLLDMDGTLLDLRYDNDFWLEHLPERYARLAGVDAALARARIAARVAETRHTLAFYCLDHWSAYLGVDVAALNEELAHLIALRPGVTAFLEALAAMGKKRILVTNSHPRGLEFKLARTGLGRLLDDVVSAHELGHPKEAQGFWVSLQRRTGFAPERALLIDDNPAVLEAARAYGVAQLRAVRHPDSRRPPLAQDGFPTLDEFRDILPARYRG